METCNTAAEAGLGADGGGAEQGCWTFSGRICVMEPDQLQHKLPILEAAVVQSGEKEKSR
jgi:hypothetical protein